MVNQNRHIKKFAKPDTRACTQKAYEQLLNDKYSAMTLDQVVDELRYLTLHNREELSGQLANLKRSYDLRRVGQFFRRHDNPKFKAMYREWKSRQPIIPVS